MSDLPAHRRSRPLAATRTLAACAAGIGAIGAAGADSAFGQALPQVIFSTFDGGTNSYRLSDTDLRMYTSWVGMFRSPNGERFIFNANVSGSTTTNRLVIAGPVATPAAREAVVRKGDRIADTMRTFNIIDPPRINDAGQYAFWTNSGGSGSPTIFFLTGTVGTPGHTARAAIGEPVPFLPGATYSNGFSSALLDNTGRFGFLASITEASVVTQAVVFDNAVIAREADPTTAPDTLEGAPSGNWASFASRRVHVDATGENFCWLGDIDNGTDETDVVAINNTAVLQEDFGIPGEATDFVQSITSVWYEPSGDWFLRSTLQDETVATTDNVDFVIRNGAVVAQRDKPITPGATTTVWDRTEVATTQGFLFHVGNNRGDYVVAGNTRNTTDGTHSAAVVLNGDTVVARRGDRLDVDGDGLGDDDAFLLGFKAETGPGMAFLTDDGELWMIVDVRNGAGADIGDAIVRLSLDLGGCAADFNNSGGAPDVTDIFAFLSAWFTNQPSADFDDSGLPVDVTDIFVFLSAWFTGCP